LLDVIDAILGAGGPWPEPDPLETPWWNGERERGAGMRQELGVILAEGRSAYRINDAREGLTAG
jgi:hypothetical protein